jgi:cell shape-determining protein MreD
VSSGSGLAFLLAIGLYLEVVLLAHMPQAHWVPHIPLILLVFMSLKRGSTSGFYLGLCLGIMMSSIADGPWILFIAIYALIGFFSGCLKDIVSIDSPLSQWVVPAIAYIILQLVQYLCIFPYISEMGWYGFVLSIQTSAIVSTTIISPMIYLVFKRIYGSTTPA